MNILCHVWTQEGEKKKRIIYEVGFLLFSLAPIYILVRNVKVDSQMDHINGC